MTADIPTGEPAGRRSESTPDGDTATSLGELGAALLDAGYAVTDVAQTLRTVGKTRGRTDLTIGVLPSAIMVDDPRVGQVRMVNATGATFTFEQVAEVASIARNAELTPMPGSMLRDRLGEMRARRPKFPRAVAVLGSGLQSAGIAVVFRTTWWAVLLDFVLALFVGGCLTYGSRIAGLAAVLPFILTFVVSLVVYGLATDLQLGAVTLFAVCAPLVVLIPGATITTGVVELSAGDVVSGGGRLVSGLIMWATLAVGIAAGAAVIGVTTTQDPAPAVPVWAMVPAVVVLGLGVGFFFDASWSLMGVLIVVLLVTFGVLTAAQTVAVGPVASGIAAAVMLPALRLLEAYRPRWPAAVTFRPAFWLLVPGSLGLVAISELTAATGQPDAQTLLSDVVATVLAISLGVQIGALVSTLVPRRPDGPVCEPA